MKCQGVRKLLFFSEYLFIFLLILLCHVHLSSSSSDQHYLLRGMSVSCVPVRKKAIKGKVTSAHT